MLKEEITELITYKYLLWNLIRRELTVRYKRSILGIFWTMLNPLMNTIVFTIIFSTIFRFGAKDFIIYFLAGYQLWMFFSHSTTLSTRCLLNNGHIFKKIYLPKVVFILAIVCASLVNLAVSMIPLLVLLPIIGKGFHPAILFLPIPIVLAICFTLGISLMLSSLTVFFHDLSDIYQVILPLWMYLTPIVYPIDIVPAKYLPYLMINPMYHLVECFRQPIYAGTLPAMSHLFWTVCASFLSLIIGWKVFSRLSDKFVYYV